MKLIQRRSVDLERYSYVVLLTAVVNVLFVIKASCFSANPLVYFVCNWPPVGDRIIRIFSLGHRLHLGVRLLRQHHDLGLQSRTTHLVVGWLDSKTCTLRLQEFVHCKGCLMSCRRRVPTEKSPTGLRAHRWPPCRKIVVEQGYGY